ncbi:bifunctional UDP-N-acetylglucosamine diphosphorylase/glucosamine-1-phosphate N-acetyltransferase GlmU [Hyphobacterium marinum]|uniref:Bifunctional protein GlmU n=1 Tax=Hyphobacterium marinum TaxID=3116574 RepID=A0ABU7M1Y7_9PROT|nr:bifunctional UDP-N-acetylglucosamine diphosphorylase/glucosamine-1-phosphate N-acetyltransferase GlmU [Hyphobacterium sp. Y6023]MEE2567285.1 bifunctional UDP-N-acetylglucosamine diphosphorylase/glucosamine-1-phosphate N-acetyltransferase GlmU [Hyphobacterium sp. Y6023]
MSQSRAAVILAAGLGTRMRSSLPKCLHPVAGRPMVEWTIALARDSGADRIVTVYGDKSRQVDEAGQKAGTLTALQDPPLGTGHAVLAAKDAMAGFDGFAIVLYGDTPLIRAETVERVFAALEDGASVAVLGFEPDEPGAYGRLIESENGDLLRIVEAKDASADELKVRLVNSGVLAAPAPLLFELLGEVTNDNANKEYYLTDVVGLAVARGLRAVAVRGDAGEVMGVNARADLAEATRVWQVRRRIEAMRDGASLQAPETVHFSYDTKLGRDIVIEPNVVFGPGVTVEDGAVIKAFSHLEGCVIRTGAQVGPYARLRPGADIGPDARIGNFVEVKKSRFGAGAKASHLSYIGDADVGAKANIGAGTITCNYDGFGKHQTVIGEGAFIGSNSSLVAPVTIGNGAYTGSGGVVTDNVPDDALALGRAKQVNKDGWATRFRAAMTKRKTES